MKIKIVIYSECNNSLFIGINIKMIAFYPNNLRIEDYQCIGHYNGDHDKLIFLENEIGKASKW